jgi:hypothetical protein
MLRICGSRAACTLATMHGDGVPDSKRALRGIYRGSDGEPAGHPLVELPSEVFGIVIGHLRAKAVSCSLTSLMTASRATREITKAVVQKLGLGNVDAAALRLVPVRSSATSASSATSPCPPDHPCLHCA